MSSSVDKTDQNAIFSMFGRIAPGYDAANRILSFGVDSLWRRHLVRGVGAAFAPGCRCRLLDLAAGTYDVSLALVRHVPGATVLAMDFCLPMLQAGKAKLARAGAYASRRIIPIAGNGLCLPLKNASVDAITVSFGLRNMQPREDALAEAYRVLTPGGVLHILEFSSVKGQVWGGLYNLYLKKVLPFIGGLITGDKEAYDYLACTIGNFPEASALLDELRGVGFRDVAAQALCGGITYLHTGKK